MRNILILTGVLILASTAYAQTVTSYQPIDDGAFNITEVKTTTQTVQYTVNQVCSRINDLKQQLDEQNQLLSDAAKQTGAVYNCEKFDSAQPVVSDQVQ